LKTETNAKKDTKRAFHGFGQAKFPDGGLVLGLSQFSILPQLPPKILLDSKVVKNDPKIIISIRDTLCSFGAFTGGLNKSVFVEYQVLCVFITSQP
jgi:hypothetical protein